MPSAALPAPGRGDAAPPLWIDVGPAALDALIGHPHFDRAMLTLIRNTVAHYRASWVMNRIISDRGRMIAGLMALDLHYQHADQGGFSLVQFREEASRHGFASPGRVTAWAATLRLLGYFAKGAPGRQERVVATGKFLAMFQERFELTWRALGQVHPPSQQAIARLDDETFLRHVASGFMQPYRNGQRGLDSCPELTEIVEREAGIFIIFSMVLRDVAGERQSIAALAREFSVSRAHVRSVVQDAEALGMVTRTGTDGSYRIEPRCRMLVSRVVAVLLRVHISVLDHALASTAEPAGQDAGPVWSAACRVDAGMAHPAPDAPC